MIKPAQISQLGNLSEIEAHCFGKEAYSKQQLEYLLEDRDTTSFIAMKGLDLVGFIIARVDLNRSFRFGHIITLDVLEQWRRKGIAQKLLKRVEMKFMKMGLRESKLEVREDNDAALALYRKMSYEIIGRLEWYYEDAHGLYLKKNLRPAATLN